MPAWGKLVPFNSDRHQGPAKGAWKLRSSSVSVGRGAGCDVTVDWKYGSRLQFELEHDQSTGNVYIVHQSSKADTFLNGGGPDGSALPEGKRVLVTRDAANADYQQPGVPSDAPIIFCNAPHLGYLCAAHGRTLGPPEPCWASLDTRSAPVRQAACEAQAEEPADGRGGDLPPVCVGVLRLHAGARARRPSCAGAAHRGGVRL